MPSQLFYFEMFFRVGMSVFPVQWQFIYSIVFWHP